MMTQYISTILKIFRDLFQFFAPWILTTFFKRSSYVPLSTTSNNPFGIKQTSSAVHRALFGFLRDSAECGAAAVGSIGAPTIAMFAQIGSVIEYYKERRHKRQDLRGDFVDKFKFAPVSRRDPANLQSHMTAKNICQTCSR